MNLQLKRFTEEVKVKSDECTKQKEFDLTGQ